MKLGTIVVEYDTVPDLFCGHYSMLSSRLVAWFVFASLCMSSS